MAPDWEMATGVDFGMGMEFGPGARYSTTAPLVSPLTPATSATATTPAYLYGALPPTADASLRVDDLLDFSNHDLYASVGVDAQFYATTTTVPGSGPSSGQTFSDRQSQKSSFDLYIPQCEDAAELEWLSKFVEDSFSDVPSYQSGAAVIAPSCEGQLRVEQPASGRGARGKRSRGPPVPFRPPPGPHWWRHRIHRRRTRLRLRPPRRPPSSLRPGRRRAVPTTAAVAAEGRRVEEAWGWKAGCGAARTARRRRRRSGGRGRWGRRRCAMRAA
ncbi:unnamed protein product [Musa textilis]